MQIVQHRVNTITALNDTPTHYGVEFDIRDKYDELIIEHDAFKTGTEFNTYLAAYTHDLMIANVKAEGIENKIINELSNYQIDNYFLLDVSLPYIVKLSNQGFTKMAIRFSEYEPIQLAQQFIGKCDWVWVDCFSTFPLTMEMYEILKPHFKICLVSPELQAMPIDQIQVLRKTVQNMEIDAVCTKRPDLWL
jgi:hypothetical protein